MSCDDYVWFCGCVSRCRDLLFFPLLGEWMESNGCRLMSMEGLDKGIRGSSPMAVDTVSTGDITFVGIGHRAAFKAGDQRRRVLLRR